MKIRISINDSINLNLDIKNCSECLFFNYEGPDFVNMIEIYNCRLLDRINPKYSSWGESIGKSNPGTIDYIYQHCPINITKDNEQ